MERFENIINGFKTATNFTKLSIIDVWQNTYQIKFMSHANMMTQLF